MSRLFRRVSLGGADGADLEGVLATFHPRHVIPREAETLSSGCFRDGDTAAALVRAWCSHLVLERRGVGGPSTTPTTTPPGALLHRPRLMPLPQRCEDLFLRMLDRPCERCGKPPRDPALCLVCGELVCCAENCCRRGMHGESAQHAAACGAGVGVFLFVKSTKILLMRGPRVCLYPSPYLDAYGEEDEYLKRGRPLFLSQARYAALSELWLHVALDYDTLALHSSRVGSDFY